MQVDFGIDPALRFAQPLEILHADDASGALHALQRADEALNSGYHIAGFLSYELGSALANLPVRDHERPLLLLGVFQKPVPGELYAEKDAFAFSPFRPRVTFEEYAAAIGRIQDAIHDGEVYQINFTVPFDGRFRGNVEAAYAHLARTSAARYSALLQSADFTVMSLSPELFLRFDGTRIETKPMKGTATPERIEELRSAKNRAEHVMIVDLLRNDLHRVCSDVRVERLFEIERYPTFATMTSTIGGTLRPGASVAEIVQAAFPCGSVTGAPKRAAMEHIARFEQTPREAYTGAVGYLSPQRQGWWNVAIRTLQLEPQTGAARFDAGGGIVADSDARSEWNEIAVKSRFLRDAIEPFTFWETFASDGPLDAHLRRLEETAREFGVPFDAAALMQTLKQRTPESRELVRLRLHLNGSVEIAAEPLEPMPPFVRVCFADVRVDSRDIMLRYKSSWRPAQTAAAAVARENDCFDALLTNERGELTEGARTNVFAEFGGRLVTPPLVCGLLPGILRGALIADGRAVEEILTRSDLARADAVYIGNSARGLVRASLVGERIRA